MSIQESWLPGSENNQDRWANLGCLPAQSVSAEQASADGAGEPAGGEPNGCIDQTIRVIATKVFRCLPKPSAVDFGDLVQAGNVGLLQARKSYDAFLGVPFVAFAKYRIRGEMLAAVHRANPLGAHVRGEKVSWTMRTVPIEDWSEGQLPLREEVTPERRILRSQHRRMLSDEIARLPVRYRAVLELKYAERYTLREIGALMRVKESRACQIHRIALGRLKEALRRRGVKAL